MYDGQTYAVSLGFFYRGVNHLLFVSSAWFDELVSELTERIAELKEQHNQAYRDESSRRRAHARQQATTLAHDERYARARNNHQREPVAQEVFSDLDRFSIRVFGSGKLHQGQ